MKKAIYYLLFPLLFGAKDNSSDLHFEEVKAIYQQIATSTGDARLFPPLILDKTQVIAHYNEDNNFIGINPNFIDFVYKEYDKNTENYIALILGHELAHFYKSHGLDHGFSGDETAPSYDDEKNKDKEMQADEFAIYYSHLAGYDAGSISSKFLDDLYTKGFIPKDSPNYPTQEERKKIYQEAAKSTQIAIKKFNVGNLLLLMEEYKAALFCFEDIGQQYPTKEVFNNMAVANIRLALQHFDAKDELKDIIYPSEFDNEISLGKVRGHNSNRGTSKTITDEDKRLRQNYLADALRYISQAINLDGNYDSAYLNRATILILQGLAVEDTRAFKHISAQNSLDQYSNIIQFFHEQNEQKIANANILKAIISLYKNGKPAAIDSLKNIKNSPLAQYNFCALSGSPRPEGCQISPPPKQGECSGYSLAKYKLSHEQSDRKKVQSIAQTGSTIKIEYNIQNSLTIYNAQQKDLEYYYFKMQINDKEYPIYIIRPTSKYKNMTCHELKLGSLKTQMTKKAGYISPLKIKQSRQLTYYHYTKQSNLIYGINSKGIIEDIIYFHSEKHER